MSRIHPTAIVDKQAEIADEVEIGPYVVVDGPVKIGPGTRVYPNAYLSGWTQIGRDCQIHPGAVVGHLPQDFHYGGERSYCKIGDRCIIREFASIHRGTQPESWTILGEDCFILGYSHIGHNCLLGCGVKLYNMSACSGHVEIGDNAIISGYSVVHQFVKIGRLVMVGGATRLGMDVPPFMMAMGESTCVGINSIGMKRNGLAADEIAEIKTAYRTLYRSGMAFGKAIAELDGKPTTPAGRELLAFLHAEHPRGIVGPPDRKVSGKSTPDDG